MNRFRAGVLITFGSFMLVTFLLIAGFFIRVKRPYYLDIVFNMTKPAQGIDYHYPEGLHGVIEHQIIRVFIEQK